jgi:hypothetical protein
MRSNSCLETTLTGRRMKLFLIFLLALLSLTVRAQVPPKSLGVDLREWSVRGSTNFSRLLPENQGVEIVWDSSRTNSFFYFPLGITLRRGDDFTLSFVFKLTELQIGSTPGKPYTFQIAAGLINLTNAFDPSMFRGSGINSDHGARNLVEFNYFPDSGFGATVAPTIVTRDNQILFSDNHPLELELNRYYKFEMSFTGADQKLRSRLWQGEIDSALFNAAPIQLRDLTLTENFSDFALDAISIHSYSDEGQMFPFAGSIQAKGALSQMELIVFNRPRVWMFITSGALSLQFETSVNWQYHPEWTSDFSDWKTLSGPFVGNGGMATIPISAKEGEKRFFRLRSERP